MIEGKQVLEWIREFEEEKGAFLDQWQLMQSGYTSGSSAMADLCQRIADKANEAERKEP